MAPRTVKLQRTTGDNLRRIISNLLVTNHYEATKEIVSNCYDADASKVKVDLVPSRMSIEDNGTGMLERELTNFTRMGDSEKPSQPFTKSGRRKIGRFGIANVLLQFMGRGYELETWRDGQLIVGEEIFSEKSKGCLDYDIKKTDRKDSGTKITIKELKFEEGDNFSLEKLRRVLAWEMPLGDDFTVLVNNKKVERVNSKPAEVYQFEETIPAAGPVKLKLEYFDSKPINGGISIFVDRRAVGSPEDFDVSKISRLLVGRVYGAVEADGLREAISFDRSRFNEGSEAFHNVRDWVYSKLKMVKNGMNGSNNGSRKEQKNLVQVQKGIELLGENIKKIVNQDTSSNGENKNSNSISTNKSYKSQPVQRPSTIAGFRLAPKGIITTPAQLDKRTGVIEFNIDHPFYDKQLLTDPEMVKLQFSAASAYTLALEKFRGTPEASKMEQIAFEYNKMCNIILGGESSERLLSIAGANAKQNQFIPFRMYESSEITSDRISVSDLNMLIETGVLNSYGSNSHRFKGKELNEYLVHIINNTPAHVLVREYTQTTGITRQGVDLAAKRINGVLTHLESFLPYVHNIGKTKPFFLVETEMSQVFLGLYAQGVLGEHLDMDQHIENHRAILEKQSRSKKIIEDRHVSLRELEYTTRTSLNTIFEILSYSQVKGYKIGMKDEELISIKDFKLAREKYLTGDNNDKK